MSAKAPTSYWTQSFLVAMDEALLHIENLRGAFRIDDPAAALAAIMQYQSSSAKALFALHGLENTTGCHQTHARAALSHVHVVARVPLALAWALVSQLPNRSSRDPQ